ncbi:MAG: biphenyl 2,3-dioxygenase [Anaerolineae bacterium SG8_19]|jgi:3-phenylpropionate/trans-cinnamate dioxygenase ferredoxin subunit|nr:MAG: biphenyl 2,3-dioxygenase [Anaerolineae bacterium SG8_19]HCB48906.1 biphenyl 2,3-dioxygenase [Chloroflexota bacterium]
MAEFVKVAKISEVPPGTRKLVDFEEVTVAIFNLDGQFYCIEDVCTHDGGPVAEGELVGFSIECPRHGALFDIRDGAVLSMPAVTPVPTYEVKVEGDDIFVESPDEW